MNRLRIDALLDLTQTLASDLFANHTYPWEVLPLIHDFILTVGPTLDPNEYELRAENVWVAKDATIYPSASITGPCIIDHEAEIRHCAFIRGNAIIGKHAVVGNSTELKNAVLFDYVQAPHYNYVGDAILGFKAHMGAGSITSNVKADKKNTTINLDGNTIETGLRKFGAILGDHAEIGCNAVLNPASVIGRDASVYPLSMVRGYVPAKHIYKNVNEVVLREIQ